MFYCCVYITTEMLCDLWSPNISGEDDLDRGGVGGVPLLFHQ